MEKSMKSWLRLSKDFEDAYTRAKDYVREEINPYIDSLDLSEDTQCDMCFPLSDDNLYVLGLDKEKLTIWVFFDDNLADI